MSFTDNNYSLASNGRGGNIPGRPGPPRRPSRSDDDFGGQPTDPDRSAFIIEMVVSGLLLAAVCALRLAGLFSGEAPFDASVFIFFFAGGAVFAALRWFLRKPYYAGVIAAFLTFLVVKFDWLEGLARLIMGERYALAGGITFCFVFASLFCLLIHALYGKDFSLRIFAGAASAALCCVVVFSAVLSLAGGGQSPAASFAEVTPSPTLSPTPSPTESPTPTPIPTPEPFGLPNIYMFVLDEFSSFDILKKYYKYDGKVFNDFLESTGFNVADVSFTTDNQTEHSICDMLNISYISRHYSKSKCYSKMKTSKLFKAWKDLGYTIFQYSNGDGHIKGPLSLRSKSGKAAYAAILKDQNFKGVAPTVPEGLTEQLSKSRFGTSKPSSSKLNEWGLYPSDYIRKQSRYRRGSNADVILQVFDYFENPDNYAPTGPRVTISYLKATHVPFTFNEYGGLLSSSRARDWRTQNVYLGQYSFMSKHLMATTSTIRANDPDSIIIIMSDHGIRYHADCSLKHKFYVSDKDSLRILNAVYIKGQKYDTEGLSAINTLRLILSLYEGHEQDYPPIKDPITTKSPSNLKGIIPRHRAPYKAPPKPKKTAPPSDPGGSG